MEARKQTSTNNYINPQKSVMIPSQEHIQLFPVNGMHMTSNLMPAVCEVPNPHPPQQLVGLDQ
jgi:hypothetical protein